MPAAYRRHPSADLTNPEWVVRVEDAAAIPADEGNRDWRAFLAWRDGGGVLDPAE